MSNTEENKEQTQQKEDKKAEESNDWLVLIQDFIKNPVTTGITGLAAGYLLGTYKASKDIEAIKQEHREQMKEQNDLFHLLVKEIRTNNKLLASKHHKLLPSNKDENEEDHNTLEMTKDSESKTYKYHPKNKKRVFELKA
jgi:hypothetical protein